MIRLVCSKMVSLLRFTILVTFGVVSFQNHGVNSQISYERGSRPSNLEATTLIPPDLRVEDEGMKLLLTRLETLCVEKLELLITDTNSRFESLESHSSEVHFTVDNIKDALGHLALGQNLLVQKLDNLTTKVDRMSKCCSVPATPVVQNIKILEAKVENLGKNLQELKDATKNVPSDVGAIKQNVSSLINVTRSLVDLSSNSELKKIFNKGLQDIKNLSTCPINPTVVKPNPRNCREVRESDKTAFGTFMIQPLDAPKPFEVVCDLETRGGGWTVIQKRFDGSQDFYLDWQHYKNGFGSLKGEFWLGLENIHLLTGIEVNELLIELGDFNDKNVSALYSGFNLGSEIEGYPINVLGAYSGDAGDSLSYYVGRKFSTKDNDQDGEELHNYAQLFNGAWWYYGTDWSSLNGRYFYRGHRAYENYRQAIYWFTFRVYDNLMHTRMLVRPKM